MTRIIMTQSGNYSVQEKFLFWWIDKTAKNDNGDDICANLTGFKTVREALANSQTVNVYIHKSCILGLLENDFLNLKTISSQHKYIKILEKKLLDCGQLKNE